MWIFDEGPVEEEAVLVFTLFVLWYQPYLLVMERISNYSHFRPVFDYFRAIHSYPTFRGRVHLPTEPTAANGGQRRVNNMQCYRWQLDYNCQRYQKMYFGWKKWYFIWSGNLFPHVKCIWIKYLSSMHIFNMLMEFHWKSSTAKILTRKILTVKILNNSDFSLLFIFISI